MNSLSRLRFGIFAPLAWVFIVSLIPSGDARAADECSSRFGSLFYPGLEASPRHVRLRELELVHFSDLFPESESVIVNGANEAVPRAKVSAKQIAEFKKLWDELLKLREDDGFKAQMLRDGLKELYKTPYPPLTPSIIENVYKKGNMTLADLQTLFLREYQDQKYFRHGDFSGWIRKNLSPQSPYSVTAKGTRLAKKTYAAYKNYIPLAIGLGLASQDTRIILETSAKLKAHIIKPVQEKIEELSPESEKAEALMKERQALVAELLKTDFKALSTPEERLARWKQFEVALQKIHKELYQIKPPPAGADPISTRQELLTSFIALQSDRSPMARATRATAMAHLCLLRDLPNAPKVADPDPVDLGLQQLAQDPEDFQRFVNEFITAKP